MTIQLPPGMMEQAAGANPGLNTMANAYQQATQVLGPALLQRQTQMAMAKGYQDIAKASGAAATQGAVTQRAADLFEKMGGIAGAQQRAAYKNAGIAPGENPYIAKMKLWGYAQQPAELRAVHAQQEAAQMMQEATQQVLGLMGDVSQSGIPTQLPFAGMNPMSGMQPTPGMVAQQAGAPQQLGQSILPPINAGRQGMMNPVQP